jgi:hypothetical protein
MSPNVQADRTREVEAMKTSGLVKEIMKELATRKMGFQPILGARAAKRDFLPCAAQAHALTLFFVLIRNAARHFRQGKPIERWGRKVAGLTVLRTHSQHPRQPDRQAQRAPVR